MGEDKINKDKAFFLFAKGNLSFMYVYKKTEKIAEATILLCSYIGHTDPFRARLEESALRLSEDALHYFLDGEEGRFEFGLIRLSSLLTLAASARKISRNNAEVMEVECYGLLSFLRERRAHLLGATLLEDPEFFSVEDLDILEKKSEAWKRGLDQNRAPQQRAVKRHPMSFNMKTSTPVLEKTADSSNVPEVRHSERKTVILDLIDKKQRVTIKDISDVVKDCSEKTIQRELASLVEGGVLKREGERRWSTYMRAV